MSQFFRDRPPGRICATAVFALTMVVTASPGMGQNRAPSYSAATCGWPVVGSAGEPNAVALVRARLNATTKGLALEQGRAGLTLLSEWVDQCDSGKSRNAVVELRRAWAASKSDLALKAALALALIRGVEVQPPGAEGINYRPAYQASNAEMEGRRLLGEVLREWAAPELGVELAALGLATRNSTTLREAETVLERLARVTTSNPGPWTALSEVQIALGRFDDAATTAMWS